MPQPAVSRRGAVPGSRLWAVARWRPLDRCDLPGRCAVPFAAGSVVARPGTWLRAGIRRRCSAAAPAAPVPHPAQTHGARPPHCAIVQQSRLLQRTLGRRHWVFSSSAGCCSHTGKPDVRRGIRISASAVTRHGFGSTLGMRFVRVNFVPGQYEAEQTLGHSLGAKAAPSADWRAGLWSAESPPSSVKWCNTTAAATTPFCCCGVRHSQTEVTVSAA